MISKSRTILYFNVVIIAMLLVSAFTPSMAKGFTSNNQKTLTIPTPVSPTGIITDTTPTFKWTRVTGATKYQYRLYKGTSTTPLWTKSVLSSACGSSTLYCVQTPVTPLALANYKWQVRVYSSGIWSPLKSFTLTGVPTSFNSQFTGSMAGWKKIGTIPWYVNSTVMYTTGDEWDCANVYRTSSLAYKNFDYSVKIKCTTTKYCENYLAIRMGRTIEPEYNSWSPGYLFGYDSGGEYAIWKAPSEKWVPIVDYKESSFIKKQGWNTIRVVAKNNTFEFWLNGNLLETVSDSTYKIGAVGILMWEYGTSQLQVDWAKLTILP